MNEAHQTQEADKKASNPCNCLEIIKAQLTKKHGENRDINLELKLLINTVTMEITPALPPLYYTFQLGKKRKRFHVQFNFCPFCGKQAD